MAVIEGAMGYYDGIAMSSEASAWALARATCTPAGGGGRSAGVLRRRW